MAEYILGSGSIEHYCLFVFNRGLWSFLPSNLVDVQTNSRLYDGLMIVGFVMWGGMEWYKVMLFVIDFCKGSEKDRMWIREDRNRSESSAYNSRC